MGDHMEGIFQEIKNIFLRYRQNESLIEDYIGYINGVISYRDYLKNITPCKYNEDFQVEDLLWEIKKTKNSNLLVKNVALFKRLFGNGIVYSIINSLVNNGDNYVLPLLKEEIISIDEIFRFIKKKYSEFNIYSIEDMILNWQEFFNNIEIPDRDKYEDVVLLLINRRKQMDGNDKVHRFLVEKIQGDDKYIYNKIIEVHNFNWNIDYCKSVINNRDIDVEFSLEYYFTWYYYSENLSDDILKYIAGLINENPICYINLIYTQYYPYTTWDNIENKLRKLGVFKPLIQLSCYYNIKYNNINVTIEKIKEVKINIEELETICQGSMYALAPLDTAFIIKEIHKIDKIEDYDFQVFAFIAEGIKEELVENKITEGTINWFMDNLMYENQIVHNERAINEFRSKKLKRINYIVEAMSYLIPDSIYFKRFFKLIYYIPLTRYCMELYYNNRIVEGRENIIQEDYVKLINEYEKLGVNLKNVIKIHVVPGIKLDEKCRESFGKLLKKRRKLVLEVIETLSLEEKLEIYMWIFELSPGTFEDDVFEALNSDVSEYRKAAIKILTGNTKYYARALELCKSKNSTNRESGIMLLMGMPEYSNKHDDLAKIYLTEKKGDLKELIENYYEEGGEELTNSEYSKNELVNYFNNNFNKIKESVIQWLPINKFSNIRWYDGQIAPEIVKKYFIYSYARKKEVKSNIEWNNIKRYFMKEDLISISYEIISAFRTLGGEAKTKWCLALACENGDSRSLEEVCNLVGIFKENDRFKMQCDCIEALALNEDNKVAEIINEIYIRETNPTIKQHILEILEELLQERNIELPERNINTNNRVYFNKEEVKEIYYDNNVLELKLDENNDLVLMDKLGTIITKAPVPNYDDEEDYESYYEYLKLEEETKEYLKTITIRLEGAISKCEIWSKESFERELRENNILLNISKGVIWKCMNKRGEFLIFTVKKLNEYIDSEEGEIELFPDSMISILHPLDISVIDLEKWNSYYRRNNIKQIIDQIDRDIHILTERELEQKPCYKFYGKEIEVNKFEKRMKASGWYRKDKTFYKRYLTYKTIVMFDYGEDNRINTINFYKRNILSKNQCFLKEINYKVISECVKDISESLQFEKVEMKCMS